MRTCITCGNPVSAGMTDQCGTFYVHEGNCFTQFMNETYGIGHWMELGNGEVDEADGYYITTANVDGGYQGTGIFYTEWEEDDINED